MCKQVSGEDAGVPIKRTQCQATKPLPISGAGCWMIVRPFGLFHRISRVCHTDSKRLEPNVAGLQVRGGNEMVPSCFWKSYQMVIQGVLFLLQILRIQNSFLLRAPFDLSGTFKHADPSKALRGDCQVPVVCIGSLAA